MPARQLQLEPGSSDLLLPFPCNWTAVIFFGMLGLLHLANAGFSFLDGHFEGYLSLGFGTIFVLVAIACWFLRFDLGILRSQGRLRLRLHLGRLGHERFIPFNDVHGVRLTSTQRQSPRNCRIEILCGNEDIECPPTPIPRQQALCLAIAMSVPLIKVSDEPPPDESRERDPVPAPQA